jgi:hypothetical protein
MWRSKYILGLGLIPLGAFAGSFMPIGNGNAAIISGIFGIVGYCILISRWSSGRDLPTTYRLTRQQMDNGDANRQAIEDATMYAILCNRL